MSNFTAQQAINAGLLTELMTVIIQPLPPEPPIIPTKLTGSYKLSTTQDSSGKFNGYAFKVNQDYLSAKSISGYFVDTEEIIKFGDSLKNAGATLNLIDDFSGSVQKYSAQQAIDNKLIFNVRDGTTEITGRFENSEGVVDIYQKPFKIGKSLTSGAFTTANGLFKFIEKSLADLRFFDQVKKMYSRQGYEIKKQMDCSERSLERNREFQANPEKYLQRLNRSKFLGNRFFNSWKTIKNN